MDKKNPLTELFSEGFKNSRIDGKIGIINLDSISNFSELRKKMGELACEGKSSGLKFKSNDTIYYLTGFADCPTSGEIGCYFRRNFLTVRNDSLILGYGKEKEKKPIRYLKTELNNIVAKPHSFIFNENKVKPALIHLYVEEKYPISTTKNVLKEIVKQFNAINSNKDSDFFTYDILFESYDISSIPPPPQPPTPQI